MTVVISPIGLVLLAGTSVTLTGLRWRRLVELMRMAQRRTTRFEHPERRLGLFLKYVMGQARLLRWPYAGILHLLIFYGFLVLMTAILQGIVEAVWVGFRWNDLPVVAGPIALAQDVFFMAVLTGVALALINRFFVFAGAALDHSQANMAGGSSIAEINRFRTLGIFRDVIFPQLPSASIDNRLVDIALAISRESSGHGFIPLRRG